MRSIVFWGLVHFMLTPFFNNHEALFVPDATELTYANTLLLSNAAISLGSAYSTRENLILFGAPNSASFILAWAFLSLQIKEFRNLGFYLSDSVYGCIFFILEGLHFLHVIVGLMLLGIYSNFGETFDCIYLIVCQDLYFSIHLLYWHFVEVIWLLLYYFLYLLFYIIYFLEYMHISTDSDSKDTLSFITYFISFCVYIMCSFLAVFTSHLMA